jgi:pimeloyl-ACP methyl ester carboxylesterase
MDTLDRANASHAYVAKTRPPSALLAWSEGWRAFVEASTLIPSLPLLRQLPRGDGHPVYLLPGFMASSESTAMLQRWLNGQGYEAIPWGFGRNLGPRGALIERLIEAVSDIARERGEPVSLIGQSLGGVYAREIAKVIPDHVRQVITLGAPFRHVNEGIAPAILRLFELATSQHPIELMRSTGDLSRPAPVPSTAIFSRADGIADWRSCIEEETSHTDNVEVFASHCGMALNPVLYYVIGDRLVQPAGYWRKFERSGVRALFFPDAVYAARERAPSEPRAQPLHAPAHSPHEPVIEAMAAG